MLIVRSLRQDRITFCVISFIIDNLGVSFVEPPALDMKAVSCLDVHTYETFVPVSSTGLELTHYCSHCFQVVEESSCRTPLIFVLSPGVDPTGALLQLAETSGKKEHFHALSLGQGQAPIARRMIEEGVENGTPASCYSLNEGFSPICRTDLVSKTTSMCKRIAESHFCPSLLRSLGLPR